MKYIFQATEKNIYLLSILILILASVFSVGYYHVDEHYQILEFAAYKLNLRSDINLPWEYHEQIRSSIQPVIVICLYKSLTYLGIESPFTVIFLLRLLSASFSFLSMWLLYILYREKISHPVLRKWFLLLSFLLWFTLFISVRFSSENWSGTFFIIAFALFFIIKNKNVLFYIGIGCILGSSFLFRYQVGFIIIGFLSWLFIINKTNLLTISYLITGIIFVIFLGFVLDRWFYGEWTITPWNYFESNIIKNVASSFGVSPWWYYLKESSLKMIPPFSFLLIISIILFPVFNIKSPITWSLLPFLAAHFIIGHKELRFLFPIVGFFPIILIDMMENIQKKYLKDLLSFRFLKFFMESFFIVNFICLPIIIFRPPSYKIYLYKYIYNNFKTPTILYYTDNHPYSKTYEIFFYRRKNLILRHVDSLKDIEILPDKNILFAYTNNKRLSELLDKKNLVYSSFPDWMTDLKCDRFRRKTWYIYDLNKTQNFKKLQNQYESTGFRKIQ